MDREGSLYFVDSLNFAIRRVDAGTGIISTVVGRGVPGETPEDGLAHEAYLAGMPHSKGQTGGEVPHAVEVDAAGNIFIGETGANRIRIVKAADGRMLTVAGTGERGADGDGGPALQARLCVHGLRADACGSLYFVDFHHHTVRRIVFPG